MDARCGYATSQGTALQIRTDLLQSFENPVPSQSWPTFGTELRWFAFQSAARSFHCSVQGGWEATPRSVLDHVLDATNAALPSERS